MKSLSLLTIKNWLIYSALPLSLYYFILAFFALTIFLDFNFKQYQQYVYMAEGFLGGHLYLLTPQWQADTVLVNNHFYFPLGPFPAIVLMPFVGLFHFFGQFFYLGYLQVVFTFLIFLLSYKLARFFSFNSQHALFLAFGFCFASVYQLIAFVPSSWYFVQSITVLLVFFAIYEYLTKRRYWLIGIVFGLVLLCRFTAGLGVLFFIFAIVGEAKVSKGKKLRKLCVLLIPGLVSGVILLLYNYVRFGNIFDNGYYLANITVQSLESFYERSNYGLFRLENISTNIYYYFIKTLDPVLVNFYHANGQQTYVLQPPYVKVSYPGVSFFVTSPMFLYIFFSNYSQKIVKWALVTSLVILFFLLMYFWPGWVQVGPRYILDLLPFWYIILLHSFHGSKLPKKVQLLILISAIFNIYLFSWITK